MRWERRVKELEHQVEEKEYELEFVKNNKSEVHDKIEKQNEQYVQEILRINQRFMSVKQEMEMNIEKAERDKKEMKKQIFNLN